MVRLAAPPQSRWLAAARGAAHRYLASVIDVIDGPDSQAFPLTPPIAAGTQAIVAEALRGSSLQELIVGERLGVDRAVAWVLRVAEALRSLHARGAAHGAVSPFSILATVRGRAISPVVSQLLLPQLGAFASPERLTGEGPSPSDDLWALGVLLYTLVTGSRPYQGDSPAALLKNIHEGKPKHFSLVTGPYLRELEVIAMRGLVAQRRRRPTSIDDVIDALDRWERRSPMSIQRAAPTVLDRLVPTKTAKLAVWDDLAFNDTKLPSSYESSLAAVEDARTVSHAPPVTVNPDLRPISISGVGRSYSAPSDFPRVSSVGDGRQTLSTFGPGRRRISSDSFSLRLRSRPRWGILAILVALVGAAAGASVMSLFGNAPGPLRNAAKFISRSDVTSPAKSPPPREHVNPLKQRDACVRSYFPRDAFSTDPDLEFVCKTENLIEVAQRLNMLAVLISADIGESSVVDGGIAVANQPSVRPANSGELVVRAGSSVRSWQLGWYELLATGIIQRNCCHEPPPIKLPATTGWCQQLQVVVTNIANQSTKSGDLSPAVHAFDEAITCLMSQGKHTVYPYKAGPTSAQKAAFQQFLTRAAESDALRASKKF